MSTRLALVAAVGGSGNEFPDWAAFDRRDHSSCRVDLRLVQTDAMTDAWTGCYDLSWKDAITPASFAHPAKMSRGLLRRILDHAFEQGWVSKGSTVVDCFGGIGSTAIEGAYRGLQVITLELEEKFVLLAKANMNLHARHWTTLGLPQPVILQGDSRKLCELVREAGVIVSSPPFQASDLRNPSKGTAWKFHGDQNYGSTPGQLGAMKAGSVNDGLHSALLKQALALCPSHHPDADLDSSFIRSHAVMLRELAATGAVTLVFDDGERKVLAKIVRPVEVMKAGSVAAVVGSPPYSERHAYPDDRTIQAVEKLKAKPGSKIGGVRIHDNVGNSPGQLAALPPGSVASVISSPPYEASVNAGKDGIDWEKAGRPDRTKPSESAHYPQGVHGEFRYGKSAGQLGAESGTTFWAASKVILEQCYQLLPPGGVAIFVVKNFVRAKREVDFTGDWRRLCEAVGFRLVCEHQAMLTKTWQEPDLFVGATTKSKERKSFFRRLAERKGSPRIDYETVVCLVK